MLTKVTLFNGIANVLYLMHLHVLKQTKKTLLVKTNLIVDNPADNL